MRKITFILLALCLFGINNSCTKYNDEDYAILSEELGGGGGSNGNCTECLVGDWKQPTQCGLIQHWIFNCIDQSTGQGTGSFSNPDCNGVCDPMIFNFHYTTDGSNITLLYDNPQPMVNCSGTMVQTGDGTNTTFGYECSGNTLTVAGAVFTK